jgi:transposase
VAQALSLNEEQHEELTRWSQSRTLPAGDVFRARLILALAEGMSYNAIKQKLHTTAPTISRWKQRFEESGIDGLEGRHKGSKPRTATPAVQAKVCRRVQQKPGDGTTHWSVRRLAAEMGLSKSSVHRILAQARLQPHRLDHYMASNDPHFEDKAADIIGLYLEPPQHAAVFCVDEKTAIQALDRLDPVLPLSPGRAERHGFEYFRHGTLSLYAALDIKTGQGQGKTHAGPRKSTLSSTTYQPIRLKQCRSSWLNTPRFDFTSLQLILPGSTRWNCGSPKFNATCWQGASSPLLPT